MGDRDSEDRWETETWRATVSDSESDSEGECDSDDDSDGDSTTILNHVRLDQNRTEQCFYPSLIPNPKQAC